MNRNQPPLPAHIAMSTFNLDYELSYQPADVIRREQERLLNEHVQHCRLHSPFYRDKLAHLPNRPLTLDDYVYLVSEYEGSPIKSLERRYGMRLEITDEQKREIAHNAYKSGLGIRNVSAQIQRMMDERIFDQFLNIDEDPGSLPL